MQERELILKAIRDGGLATVMERINEDKANVNTPLRDIDYDKEPAIFVAAEAGQYEITKYLIGLNADVNFTSPRGQTVLTASAGWPYDGDDERIYYLTMADFKTHDLAEHKKNRDALIIRTNSSSHTLGYIPQQSDEGEYKLIAIDGELGEILIEAPDRIFESSHQRHCTCQNPEIINLVYKIVESHDDYTHNQIRMRINELLLSAGASSQVAEEYFNSDEGWDDGAIYRIRQAKKNVEAHTEMIVNSLTSTSASLFKTLGTAADKKGLDDEEATQIANSNML